MVTVLVGAASAVFCLILCGELSQVFCWLIIIAFRNNNKQDANCFIQVFVPY